MIEKNYNNNRNNNIDPINKLYDKLSNIYFQYNDKILKNDAKIIIFSLLNDFFNNYGMNFNNNIEISQFYDIDEILSRESNEYENCEIVLKYDKNFTYMDVNQVVYNNNIKTKRGNICFYIKIKKNNNYEYNRLKLIKIGNINDLEKLNKKQTMNYDKILNLNNNNNIAIAITNKKLVDDLIKNTNNIVLDVENIINNVNNSSYHVISKKINSSFLEKNDNSSYKKFNKLFNFPDNTMLLIFPYIEEIFLTNNNNQKLNSNELLNNNTNNLPNSETNENILPSNNFSETSNNSIVSKNNSNLPNFSETSEEENQLNNSNKKINGGFQNKNISLLIDTVIIPQKSKMSGGNSIKSENNDTFTEFFSEYNKKMKKKT